ncbi:hypothetical protein [Neorickettsia sennetsu]|uniref:hypothetical protein n=1 Tax=Ehrlichia sennetsu TaxID=951 RepID=UPI000316A1E3|nr:hypothetical protein [Neorickettsia sennetsu]
MSRDEFGSKEVNVLDAVEDPGEGRGEWKKILENTDSCVPANMTQIIADPDCSDEVRRRYLVKASLSAK